MTLIIIKGDDCCDVSKLVKKVKWRGRKGSSARSIEVELIDDSDRSNARANIDVEEGHQCLFIDSGDELFRGIATNQSQKYQKLTFKAYDYGIYLANNKDTFVYIDKTASEIYKDICSRYSLSIGSISDTSYRIPELIKPSTSAYDTILDALSLDYKATGMRHYTSCNKGKFNLFARRENILQWVIETGQNLTDYSYSKSIYDIKTRVKILSDENTVLAEEVNSELEGKIGAFTDVKKISETMTEAQLNELASSIMSEKGTVDKSFSIESIGINDVVSGVGVFIIVNPLGISNTFYVDEDVHIYEDGCHTMQLSLSAASDIW